MHFNLSIDTSRYPSGDRRDADNNTHINLLSEKASQ